MEADVRIVTATNRDLAAEVEEGRFRSDLFYRINVIRIVLPALRERKEDIALLTDHIIQKMNLLKNKEIAGPSPGVLEAFMNHDWPGNIRELENIIERAFILCPGGMIIAMKGYLKFLGNGEEEERVSDLAEAIARLGREGWELASHSMEFTGAVTQECFYFKRPLEEQA